MKAHLLMLCVAGIVKSIYWVHLKSEENVLVGRPSQSENSVTGNDSRAFSKENNSRIQTSHKTSSATEADLEATSCDAYNDATQDPAALIRMAALAFSNIRSALLFRTEMAPS